MRFPLLVFHAGLPKASVETRREDFFLCQIAERIAKDAPLEMPQGGVMHLLRSAAKKEGTMKFVLDELDNGTWRIDIRDDANRTKGHLLLSQTGLGWVNKNKKSAGVHEIVWEDVKKHFT